MQGHPTLVVALDARDLGATEPLEDPLRLRWIRKDIARLKTILRERELETAR